MKNSAPQGGYEWVASKKNREKRIKATDSDREFIQKEGRIVDVIMLGTSMLARLDRWVQMHRRYTRIYL